MGEKEVKRGEDPTFVGGGWRVKEEVGRRVERRRTTESFMKLVCHRLQFALMRV